MPNVYIYVVRYDLGFAPNPYNSVCTLACCMPVIRRMASHGDWIIGMGGSELKATGRCIYAMKVTRSLTFDQYWNAKEFHSKRPVRHGSRRTMVGDNVYHRHQETKKWLQENCVHSQINGEQDVSNTNHDTRTDRVLISDEFYYFGGAAPVVPPRLLRKLGYKNQRGYRKFSLNDSQALLDWIRIEGGAENRVIADPFQFRQSEKRFSRMRNKLV
jgi:hypothetical protein